MKNYGINKTDVDYRAKMIVAQLIEQITTIPPTGTTNQYAKQDLIGMWKNNELNIEVKGRRVVSTKYKDLSISLEKFMGISGLTNPLVVCIYEDNIALVSNLKNSFKKGDKLNSFLTEKEHYTDFENKKGKQPEWMVTLPITSAFKFDLDTNNTVTGVKKIDINKLFFI